MAEAELQGRFSPNKPLEPDVLTELQSIMRLHNLTAEDLFYKWESYCIKMDIDSQAISLAVIRNLKQTILDSLEKTNNQRGQAKVHATPRPAARGGGGGGGGSMLDILEGYGPSTPVTGGKLVHRGGSGLKRKLDTPMATVGSSPVTSGMGDQLKALNVNGASSVPFNERKNAGEVVETLNDHLPVAEPPIAPYSEPRIKLTAASDQKKMAYKPLAMKLSEASEILDDRIDEFTNLIQGYHKLDDSAFGSAATQSTTEVVAVGRIASDAMEGKLNAASLVLETPRRLGMGLRVPLNMSRQKNWSFFPGQIVALRGINTSGHDFIVNEILSIPLLNNAASSPSNLEAHIQRLHGGADAMDSDSDPSPLNIIFAAGPYTADDNLDFEPLHALCTQAADTYADVLVLNGPFIDVDHPLIATGDFDLPEEAQFDPDTATMTTVFKYLFSVALNRLCSINPHLTVVLVPSVRDIIDKHVSWPQDAFPRKELGLPKAVRIVSNPMSLSINEMLLGISSQDALFELRSEEVSKFASGNMLERLCRYLIEQRHFFPLFPPMDRKSLPKTGTEEGIATGAVMDVSYLKLGEIINVRPDVMVTPSSLPPFAKVVESVLVINPGPLSKRRGAGTYARMTLYPPTIKDAGVDQMLDHRIYERARVEIVRV
ncbi:unnamed protein product [Clonostachys chloroleuca]|uniref:DNA polymerase alpha subunit B n=1 Tax=Clonostachys chloroleuca TaxID=1926264 RepID=A0AA35MG38_9HYPO|nr:unnamed protein product [Clonostachys chloroleuca]